MVSDKEETPEKALAKRGLVNAYQELGKIRKLLGTGKPTGKRAVASVRVTILQEGIIKILQEIRDGNVFGACDRDMGGGVVGGKD